MPKSHFPPRGGPHPPAWASGAHRPTERGSGVEPNPPRLPEQGFPHQRALEAEVQRLRQELARAQSAQGENLSPAPAARGTATNGMIWVALALCGLGLVFALLAILHHG